MQEFLKGSSPNVHRSLGIHKSSQGQIIFIIQEHYVPLRCKDSFDNTKVKPNMFMLTDNGSKAYQLSWHQ